MKVTKIYTIDVLAQSIYYSLTALWGLLHIQSFMDVTGPKTDIWLVKTVSVLILPIVIGMLSGLLLRAHPVPVILLATSAALGFAAIDFYYTARSTIRWVYALDGAVQVLLLAVWLYLLRNRRQLAAWCRGSRNAFPG